MVSDISENPSDSRWRIKIWQLVNFMTQLPSFMTLLYYVAYFKDGTYYIPWKFHHYFLNIRNYGEEEGTESASRPVVEDKRA